MSRLGREEKELILDYGLGIASPEQVRYVEKLISSSEEASELLQSIRSVLAPLGQILPESCPQALADRTVARLIQAADTGTRLDQLLAREEAGPKVIRPGLWRNLAQTAAVAAVLILAAGVTVSALGSARQTYYQQRCQSQLAGIYSGISEYTSDHNGQLPSVATASGEPWWKVGYQGRENHSNTRPVWLLVRKGYVEDPSKFVCPQRKCPALGAPGLSVQDYNDFPSADHVTYSFRLCNSKKTLTAGPQVIMADMNPLSERLPRDYSKPALIRLDPSLLSINSTNHNRRGQNVLLCSGSVGFQKTRQVGAAGDDIFSLASMTADSEVTGCEMPSCETDVFLVP